MQARGVAPQDAAGTGSGSPKSTRSGELSRLVAAEKALNNSVLELAPTWWLAFAAFDNLVALPKTNSNSLATIQIFLFFARPMMSHASAGLRAPAHKEHAAPRWTDADEQQFARGNFIYGYPAIEEELAALPRAPLPLQAAVQRVATLGPKPDEQFVGAARFFPPDRAQLLHADGVAVRLDPHLGEVNEAAVRDILRRIAPALKIGPGFFDRRTATIVCDADIRRHVANLIKNSNSHEFGWVHLQPAQWHASLCFRLTIGATWGEIFLFKMVEEVEHVTENTAAHISSGKRWRRSGNISIRRDPIPAAVVPGNPQQQRRAAQLRRLPPLDGGHRQGQPLRRDHWRLHPRCGVNLQLDDAVRRGNYEEVIEISAIFHWLTVSRGRHQYKEILAMQIADWALSNEEERDTIEQATFCVNNSGRFNASDETYESMLKIVKQFLRGALHARTIASSINCTYKANVFTRIKMQLDHDLHSTRPAQPSTRPSCIKTDQERQRVNAYAKAFSEWVPRDATRGTEIKAFRTGVSIRFKLNSQPAGAIVDAAMTSVFEDGRVESEAIVEALCNGDSVCWDNGDKWLLAGGYASAPPLPPPSEALLVATHSQPLVPLPASPPARSDLVPRSAPSLAGSGHTAAPDPSADGEREVVVSRQRPTPRPARGLGAGDQAR
jgi:hypothetical protein